MNKIVVIILLLSVSFFSSCGSNSNSDKDSFDRTAFLSQASSTFLLSLENLHEKVVRLDSTVLALTNAPDSAKLLIAQSAWKQAYLQFLTFTPYNFGPSGEQGLNKSITEEIATFPVSESKVASRLQSGTFNLNDFDRDARGLFTLEFLLFGKVEDASIHLSRFSQTNYKNFAVAVSANLKTRVETVKSNWNAQEIAQFVANNGTDAGSSTSILFNEYVKSFEALKNFKVQVPMGLRPGQTVAEPHLVEAFYSKHSIEGLKAHYETIKQIWGINPSSIGFRGYLQSVSGGADLISRTQEQFTAVDNAFAAIENEGVLSVMIVQRDTRLDTLQTELQKLTRFLKSDLSSLIGIAITYSSGDGD